MEELSLDNILSGNLINDLFSEDTTEPSFNSETEESQPKETVTEEEKRDDINEIQTTEVSPNLLFDNDLPESVGSEDANEEQEDATSNEASTSSNFYSSIANALVEDGILQSLTKEDLSEVNSAEDFARLIDSEIRTQLDERSQRVEAALNSGIKLTEVQKYERYINNLNSIDDSIIEAETEQSENLRKNLIYQDCINKGFSKERALKTVDKAFRTGTDIDDAKEALADSKEFIKDRYSQVLQLALLKLKEEIENHKQKLESLKTSILEDEKAFGGVSIDKNTRLKAYESITKPTYTDPESGKRLTALLKYEQENRTEFIKNVGLLFTLTDGFKNIDKLISSEVRKETNKNLRKLEHTLSSSKNNYSGGNLTFANNSGSEDTESLFKGWKLSI